MSKIRTGDSWNSPTNESISINWPAHIFAFSLGSIKLPNGTDAKDAMLSGRSPGMSTIGADTRGPALGCGALGGTEAMKSRISATCWRISAICCLMSSSGVTSSSVSSNGVSSSASFNGGGARRVDAATDVGRGVEPAAAAMRRAGAAAEVERCVDAAAEVACRVDVAAAATRRAGAAAEVERCVDAAAEVACRVDAAAEVVRRAGTAAETARRVDVAAEVDLAARRVLEVAAAARVGTTADERVDVAEATEVAACGVVISSPVTRARLLLSSNLAGARRLRSLPLLILQGADTLKTAVA